MRDIKEYLHNNRHMQESMEVHQNKKNEFYQTNKFFGRRGPGRTLIRRVYYRLTY